LNEAVELNPYYESAVVLYAELKIQKGSPAAATDALVELLKQEPQSKDANYLLATSYLAQQLREPAMRILRQMTELFPNDPQPWHLMGTVLLAQNLTAEARKAFERSAEIAPDFLGAIEQLVDLDIAAGQYATALGRIQKRIDADPKTAPAWALRGKIYLAQRDFSRAEPDLLKAIELEPQLEPLPPIPYSRS
jgi:tetratricopeptide (TPR) repeat protein